jgi:hypothetical protein
VLEAEAEAGVDDDEPATLAVGEAEVAAGVRFVIGLVVGRGFEGKGRGLGLVLLGGDDGLCHFGLLSCGELNVRIGEWGWMPPPPGVFGMNVKGKELREKDVGSY